MQSETISTQTENRDEAEIYRQKESLASYCRDMRNALSDAVTKDKFSAEERTLIEESHRAGLEYVNHSSLSTTADDFKKKLVELELKFAPIAARIKQEEKTKLDDYCKQLKSTLSDRSIAPSLTD